MARGVQIASVFTAIGFKVNKKDLDRLQKQLGNLKKQLVDLKSLVAGSPLKFDTNTSELKAAREQLSGINAELSKIKSKTLRVNVARGGAAGGARTGGRVGRGAFAGSALGSQLGQFGPGVGISGGIAFGGFSILKTGQRLEAVRAGLIAAAGGAEEGAEAFAFMNDLSERLGINFEDNVRSYQNFLAAANSLNFSTEKTREVFEATASSARVLGLSAADTNGIMRAMTQILSKGTVQSEELRGQLGERLPGAVGLMAKAIGVSVVELNKMLENGEVISKDVLPKMADAMIKFAKANGALDKAVNSNLANQERLANAWFFFKAGIAESGFMDTMTNVFTDFAKILGGNSKAATTIGIIFTGLARVFKSVGNVIGNIVIAISEMSTGFKVALAALIFLLIPFSTWALAIVTVIGFLEELFALLRGEDNLITNFIENADFLAIALAGVSAAILGILALGRLSLMFTGMTTAAAGVSSLTRGLVLLRGALTLIGKHPVFLALTAIAAVVTAIAAASNFEGDTESASIKAGLARGLRRREPDQDLAPSGFKGRGSAETTLRIELSDDLKGNITDIQSNQPTTLPESQ